VIDYCASNYQFESRLRLAISSVPSVNPAAMGTCIALSQRQLGMVLATSPHCMPWLWKPVCTDSVEHAVKSLHVIITMLKKVINGMQYIYAN